MASSQVSEKVSLHELHDHPNIILLEGDAEKLDDVLVTTAPQNRDLLQQQFLLLLTYIPLKDLDCHFMYFCQHTSIHLRDECSSVSFVITAWPLSQA